MSRLKDWLIGMADRYGLEPADFNGVLSFPIVSAFYGLLHENDVESIKIFLHDFPMLINILPKTWVADMQFWVSQPYDDYDHDNYYPYFPSIEILKLLKEKTDINAIITDVSNKDNISSISEYISNNMQIKHSPKWKYSKERLILLALAYKENKDKEYIHNIMKFMNDKELGSFYLHDYVQYGKDVIKAIIEGENIKDVDVKDTNQRTPLHIAVLADNYDTAEFLIKKGANVNAKDIAKRTPLTFVKTAKMAELLLKHGADVNATDYAGRTPLIFAGNLEIEKILIKYGANDSMHITFSSEKKGTQDAHVYYENNKIQYNVYYDDFAEYNLSKRQLVNRIVHHWFDNNKNLEDRLQKLEEFNELRKTKDGLKGFFKGVLEPENSIEEYNKLRYGKEPININGVNYLVNLGWGDPASGQRDCFYDFIVYAESLGYKIEIIDPEKLTMLNRMGSSWFVSRIFHDVIDPKHNNWRMVDNSIRENNFEKSKQRHYHKEYLQKILEANVLLLEKNKIGLGGNEIKKMAQEVLDKVWSRRTDK